MSLEELLDINVYSASKFPQKTLDEYLGVRGLGRKDNFNSRFLLLVDGYRANDTIYENAPIGTDRFLDANGRSIARPGKTR